MLMKFVFNTVTDTLMYVGNYYLLILVDILTGRLYQGR